MTEAERRSAEIKARKRASGSARPADEITGPLDRPAVTDAPDSTQWIDEGSVREAAVSATARAASPSAPSPRRRSRRAPVDPELVASLTSSVGSQRADRLVQRLADAQEALERDRLDEARRLVTPIVREAPGVAGVHELAGLVHYRLGRWKQAARELEVARGQRESVELLPVLADCYRGLQRWDDVDRVWESIKRASPSHDVMAEGRIVAAGSLADRGRMSDAISLLAAASTPPKRVRDHHLRQWYALADLYDRAGDTMSAIRWFRAIAAEVPEFVDVADRLRALGR